MFNNGLKIALLVLTIALWAPTLVSADQIYFVNGQNSMLADCVINENTKATLLIDTGASICMFSKKLGDELGIDTSDPRHQTKVQVADGRSVPAFYTRLRSLRLQPKKIHY